MGWDRERESIIWGGKEDDSRCEENEKPEAWFHEFNTAAPSKCVCSLIAGCVYMCESVCQLRGYYVRFSASVGCSMKWLMQPRAMTKYEKNQNANMQKHNSPWWGSDIIEPLSKGMVIASVPYIFPNSMYLLVFFYYQ